MGLGIILLDDVYPGFPGDVRNASGYPFPIQYEIARDVDIHRLVVEEDKSPCLEPVRRAAQHLEEMAAGPSRPSAAISPTSSARSRRACGCRSLCLASCRCRLPSS
jgi:hypothetical protein